jgi:hypothetical protein
MNIFSILHKGIMEIDKITIRNESGSCRWWPRHGEVLQRHELLPTISMACDMTRMVQKDSSIIYENYHNKTQVEIRYTNFTPLTVVLTIKVYNLPIFQLAGVIENKVFHVRTLSNKGLLNKEHLEYILYILRYFPEELRIERFQCPKMIMYYGTFIDVSQIELGF